MIQTESLEKQCIHASNNKLLIGKWYKINIKKSEADNQGLMAIKWQLKEEYCLLMFNWISQQTENVTNRREPTAEY